LDRTPQLVGAPTLWGPTLTTAGQGVKIGIIDDGIDQTHPFFAAAGFAYPPGFPKGQTAYTTPKVIVARAFPPPHASYKNAGLPFDPSLSDHGIHVAGIAAGNNDFGDLGFGSSTAPANAAKVISVGASSGGHGSTDVDVAAGSSSAGPTPYSLQFKPDVTAPGEDVLSAAPGGSYVENSGTS